MASGYFIKVHGFIVGAVLQAGEAVVADRIDHQLAVPLEGIGVMEDKAGVGVDHLHGVGAVTGDDKDFRGLFGVKANALRRAFEAQ